MSNVASMSGAATTLLRDLFNRRAKEFFGKLAVEVDEDLKKKKTAIHARVCEIQTLAGAARLDPDLLFGICVGVEKDLKALLDLHNQRESFRRGGTLSPGVQGEHRGGVVSPCHL